MAGTLTIYQMLFGTYCISFLSEMTFTMSFQFRCGAGNTRARNDVALFASPQLFGDCETEDVVTCDQVPVTADSEHQDCRRNVSLQQSTQPSDHRKVGYVAIVNINE